MNLNQDFLENFPRVLYVYIYTVLILGLFSTALRRVAPVRAEVPFCSAVLSFPNAVLQFFICCISSPIPHSLLYGCLAVSDSLTDFILQRL